MQTVTECPIKEEEKRKIMIEERENKKISCKLPQNDLFYYIRGNGKKEREKSRKKNKKMI